MLYYTYEAHDQAEPNPYIFVRLATDGNPHIILLEHVMDFGRFDLLPTFHLLGKPIVGRDISPGLVTSNLRPAAGYPKCAGWDY